MQRYHSTDTLIISLVFFFCIYFHLHRLFPAARAPPLALFVFCCRTVTHSTRTPKSSVSDEQHTPPVTARCACGGCRPRSGGWAPRTDDARARKRCWTEWCTTIRVCATFTPRPLPRLQQQRARKAAAAAVKPGERWSHHSRRRFRRVGPACRPNRLPHRRQARRRYVIAGCTGVSITTTWGYLVRSTAGGSLGKI